MNTKEISKLADCELIKEAIVAAAEVAIKEGREDCIESFGTLCMEMINRKMLSSIQDFEDIILRLPGRTTAWWTVKEKNRYEYFTCSECGGKYLNGCENFVEAMNMLTEGNVPNFCPNCGAKMLILIPEDSAEWKELTKLNRFHAQLWDEHSFLG